MAKKSKQDNAKRILRARDICRALDISECQFNRMLKTKEFPPPIRKPGFGKYWTIYDFYGFLGRCVYSQTSRDEDLDRMDSIVREAQKTKKELAKPGFVYFVRTGDFVKIGYTENVKSRMGGLQTSTPYKLELVHSIVGTFRKERELHRRFACHLVREGGEWFHWCDEISQYIEELKAGGAQ